LELPGRMDIRTFQPEGIACLKVLRQEKVWH
jgi:hypothetical protein